MKGYSVLDNLPMFALDFCKNLMNDLLKRLDHPPSALQELEAEEFARRGVRLLIKRDDLLHPHISGNKWRKLKFNLLEARRQGAHSLISFGGAYSNHLAAVAAAGVAFGFSTRGIVRGERVLPLNSTLTFLEKCGMELTFASRTAFREKAPLAILEDLKIDLSNAYVLPMGGTNCLALPGCAEIISEIEVQLGDIPSFTGTACGTGGTLTGIASGLQGRGRALGVCALKGDFLKKEIAQLLQNCALPACHNLQLFTDYHFGGFARVKPPLIDFINRFKQQHGIQLEPVYTGKLFFAVFDLLEKGFFKKGDTVVLIHTGGLQGLAGFPQILARPGA